MAGEGVEIRFGLVLYGGVSLAVYIYGVVVEVQRLLRAAAQLKGGGNPDEMSAYARALVAAGASGVTVDIVSGTSAGGINGILLAKALARGTDVGLVRDLWLEGGDVDDLLQRREARDPKALLRSQSFEKTLEEGLELLDAEEEDDAPPSPPVLDLFVSSTHLRGGSRRFSDSLGSEVATRQHRYVFHLKLRNEWTGPGGLTLGYDNDDFADNDRLIRLARATSAFPVAFEPVEIRLGDGLLDPADLAGGWFADGGILNNKPFSEAIETIFSRSSERPVHRWLISIDPDPVPIGVEDSSGGEPAFDQIALRSVAAIPRYQSIAQDLVALEEHNQRVGAAQEVVIRLEAEIAAANAASNEDGGEPPLGAGPSAAYATLRRQAWALEIADGLTAAVRESVAAPVDRLTLHRDLRDAAQEHLKSSARTDWDLSFQLRRIYYLIKLLAIAERVEPGNPVATRAALWAEFEAISAALWSSLVAPGTSAVEGALPWVSSPEGNINLLEAEDRLARVARDSTDRLREALVGVVVHLPGFRPEDGNAPIEVRLIDVLLDFPRRDATLLPAELYGDLRRRDRVEHAQVSPVAAVNTTVPATSKLAGDSLGHFGGFLDRGWRENDLMWGRLDGAEMLMRTILNGYAGEDRGTLLDTIQEEVLRKELPQVLEGPEHWKEKLRAHVGAGPSPADLGRRGLTATGLRASSIVHRMLRTAAKTAEHGSLLASARAAALSWTAHGLAVLLALVYLPSKLFLPRSRR